jgi:hypothetical protein
MPAAKGSARTPLGPKLASDTTKMIHVFVVVVVVLV